MNDPRGVVKCKQYGDSYLVLKAEFRPSRRRLRWRTSSPGVRRVPSERANVAQGHARAVDPLGRRMKQCMFTSFGGSFDRWAQNSSAQHPAPDFLVLASTSHRPSLRPTSRPCRRQDCRLRCTFSPEDSANLKAPPADATRADRRPVVGVGAGAVGCGPSASRSGGDRSRPRLEDQSQKDLPHLPGDPFV